MITVIDNYDSFTYNLVQFLGELGAEVQVHRNDQVTVDQIVADNPSHIIISPGPGTPAADAGISNEVIGRFHGVKPILGVCLGHQCITHTFGGTVSHAPRLMHGKTSPIQHDGDPLFDGVPSPFQATRYHSLIALEPLPASLKVLARTAEGEIMALRHQDANTYGVQFHPESILTPEGKQLLRNFLALDGAVPRQASTAAPEHAFGPIDALRLALEGGDMSMDQAKDVMGEIMDGNATPAQIAGLLIAMRVKGETVQEITGFAQAMRDHAVKVRPTCRHLIDTCGTGGDGAHTFNISTTAALVVAGAGIGVAKHGNRSVSSKCGSADVLKALGVNLDITPDQVADCIDEVGFGFLFAPGMHPAMKHAIGPRREMQVRTVFNILGPLTNPAGAETQLIGVYDEALVEPIAQVLKELGSKAAFVVHGHGGLDELSTTGVNTMARLVEGQVEMMALDPAELGLAPADLCDLQGDNAEANAAITQAVLAGQRGPQRDIVLLNAGMALVAAGRASTPEGGIALAAESIDSGKAADVLERLIAFTGGPA